MIWENHSSTFVLKASSGTSWITLSELFAASFLVAYQQVQKNFAKEALDDIPQAEIILPQSVATPTLVDSPTPTPTSGQGQFCGGIANLKCPGGFYCAYEPPHPDAGGTCVAQ